MKKLLLSSVVLLALGTSAMAQKASLRGKTKAEKIAVAKTNASGVKKAAKTAPAAAPVSDAQMTVQSEAARKKNAKASN